MAACVERPRQPGTYRGDTAPAWAQPVGGLALALLTCPGGMVAADVIVSLSRRDPPRGAVDSLRALHGFLDPGLVPHAVDVDLPPDLFHLLSFLHEGLHAQAPDQD